MVELKAINLVCFWGGLAFYWLLERFLTYRASSVSKTRRWVDNIGLAVFNGALLNLAFAVPIFKTAEYVQQNRLGIFYLIELPFWLRIVITVVFLDFMLYIWHFMNHELPFFWRFHRVHHSDLNLDVSTASRFHLGELSISAVIKMSLVFFLGAELVGLILFEVLLVLTSQFQHSNIRVPGWFEKIWLVFFVPPSMHRIHHSVVIKERNTNYGTILSVWDKWLGTFLYGLDQARIRIGLGAYPKAEKVRFSNLLTMPFTKAVR